MRRLLTSILLAVAVATLAACGLDPFLFNAQELNAYLLPGNTIPDSLITEVTLQSGGNTIYGYWVASEGSRAGVSVLYCHGNKNSIDEYWDRVLLLHQTGVNVFIFDYRGFGRSEGRASESGLYEDAEAALVYMTGLRSVSPDSLVIYGYSLGNVPSIHLATEVVVPLGLVAEAPFASAASLAQGALVLDIPSGWLTEGTFDNAARIESLTAPFLQFHGRDDAFVRWRDNGRVVWERAPEPKILYLVDGADHTDIPEVMGESTYLTAFMSWLDAYR